MSSLGDTSACIQRYHPLANVFLGTIGRYLVTGVFAAHSLDGTRNVSSTMTSIAYFEDIKDQEDIPEAMIADSIDGPLKKRPGGLESNRDTDEYFNKLVSYDLGQMEEVLEANDHWAV